MWMKLSLSGYIIYTSMNNNINNYKKSEFTKIFLTNVRLIRSSFLNYFLIKTLLITKLSKEICPELEFLINLIEVNLKKNPQKDNQSILNLKITKGGYSFLLLEVYV